MTHLKRIRAPTTWAIRKKDSKFATNPNPGAHSLSMSVPIIIIIRDMLDYAKTRKEVIRILQDGSVKVNTQPVIDYKRPVGVMDTVSFEKIDEHYRVMINSKGKLCLNKTTKERIKIRPVKIIGKTSIKKGKTQLNFSDGTNLLVDKDTYAIGDTIIVEAPSKIIDHIKFMPGSYVYFTKGKKVGSSGTIEDVSQEKVFFKDTEGNKIETSKKYAFVVGKEKPSVVLPK